MKYLLLLLTFSLFISCTKEEPKPDPPKPNEADTMHALINGEEWSAYCESSWPGFGCIKVKCQYYNDTGGFQIGAGGPPGYVIAFSKTGGQGGVHLGTNVLPYRSEVLICNASICTGESSCRRFDLDSTYLNILEILDINIELRIIEGKFEYRAVNQECSDTILVTDGYFRTNY